jgi:hypothetical protein
MTQDGWALGLWFVAMSAYLSSQTLLDKRQPQLWA